MNAVNLTRADRTIRGKLYPSGFIVFMRRVRLAVEKLRQSGEAVSHDAVKELIAIHAPSHLYLTWYDEIWRSENLMQSVVASSLTRTAATMAMLQSSSQQAPVPRCTSP